MSVIVGKPVSRECFVMKVIFHRHYYIKSVSVDFQFFVRFIFKLMPHIQNRFAI